MSKYEKAFDVFRQFEDGLACFEFVQLFECDSDKQCASARLSQFVLEGLAVKIGSRANPETNNSGVVYVPTGVPYRDRNLEPREPRRKRRGPYESELKALRKWKANAIDRYPELGLDSAILKARAQVASILRMEGNSAKAVMVERGDLDDGETMRIILAMVKDG